MHKKLYIQLIIILFPVLLYAADNAVLSGFVLDADDNEPVMTAQIELVGQQMGAATDMDGKYTIEQIPPGTYTITASFIGYKSVSEQITFRAGDKRRKDFNLKKDVLVGEIATVTIAKAEKRKTPISFTDLPKPELVRSVGSRDLPMALSSTPGVYASEGGGGSGDSRINIRGFDQRNVAVMVNGVPVNDMEWGGVYWSNWSNLSDVTSSVQVQRGMGASNLAIGSVGGTMNIVTDAAEMKPGFSLKQSFGQDFGLDRSFAHTFANDDAYLKTTISGSTGLINNQFALSAAFTRKTRAGYVDETWSDEYGYFLGLSYLPSKHHKLDFYAVGAPQQHAQRPNYAMRKIRVWDSEYALELGADTTGLTRTPANYERGMRYNPSWGILDWQKIDADPLGAKHSPMKDFYNGEEHDVRDINQISTAQNYYHKPQFNLNWAWDINDLMRWTNIAYVSLGEGGGANISSSSYLVPKTGQIDLQYMYMQNVRGSSRIDNRYSTTENKSRFIMYNGVNNHQWVGGVSTLNYRYDYNLDFTAGLDYRFYRGEHWREVRNLLGGDYWLDASDKNSLTDSTAHMKRLGDKYLFHNDGLVQWFGGFTTAEYRIRDLYLFGNIAVSGKGYKRVDYFLNKDSVDQETIWKWFPGYGVKAGANYNLTKQVQVFSNVGYLSLAPEFSNVWGNSNLELQNVANEKVISAEVGSGYQYERILDADMNLYYTYWQDKTTKRTNYLVQGVDAVHMGAEFTATYRPHKMVRLKGAMSFGNWEWAKDVYARFTPEDDTTVFVDTLLIKGLKVGDAPQTTMSLGLTLMPVKGGSVTINVNRASDHYADYSPEEMIVKVTPDPLKPAESYLDRPAQSWKMPTYVITNLNAYYELPFKVSGVQIDFQLNVYNLFNTKYITDAVDSSPSSDPVGKVNGIEVFFGRQRSWSAGVGLTF